MPIGEQVREATKRMKDAQAAIRKAAAEDVQRAERGENGPAVAR